jgi:hypothetical protein
MASKRKALIKARCARKVLPPIKTGKAARASARVAFSTSGPGGRVLRIKDLAARYGCSPRSITRMVIDGAIPPPHALRGRRWPFWYLGEVVAAELAQASQGRRRGPRRAG